MKIHSLLAYVCWLSSLVGNAQDTIVLSNGRIKFNNPYENVVIDSIAEIPYYFYKDSVEHFSLCSIKFISENEYRMFLNSFWQDLNLERDTLTSLSISRYEEDSVHEHMSLDTLIENIVLKRIGDEVLLNNSQIEIHKKTISEEKSEKNIIYLYYFYYLKDYNILNFFEFSAASEIQSNLNIKANDLINSVTICHE